MIYGSDFSIQIQVLNQWSNPGVFSVVFLDSHFDHFSGYKI